MDAWIRSTEQTPWRPGTWVHFNRIPTPHLDCLLKRSVGDLISVSQKQVYQNILTLIKVISGNLCIYLQVIHRTFKASLLVRYWSIDLRLKDWPAAIKASNVWNLNLHISITYHAWTPPPAPNMWNSSTAITYENCPVFFSLCCSLFKISTICCTCMKLDLLACSITSLFITLIKKQIPCCFEARGS